MAKGYVPSQLFGKGYLNSYFREPVAPLLNGQAKAMVVGSRVEAVRWQLAILKALDSERVRQGLKDILLGPAQLYEALRGRTEAADPAR